MKLKRILPIIVAVSVLLCAFVPFSVSAKTIDLGALSIPDAENNMIDKYGGFDKVVMTSDYNHFCIAYLRPIGYNPGDPSPYAITMHYITENTFRSMRGGSLENIVSIYRYDLSNDHARYYGSNFCDDCTIIYSTCDIYDSNRANIIFSKSTSSPTISVNLLDKPFSKVNTSLALVEVLGVLPACLACLVAYASIRKGIGYVHAIISNA